MSLQDVYRNLDGFALSAKLQGVVGPSPTTIQRAKDWAAILFFSCEAQDLPWKFPHITVDEMCNIDFEFYCLEHCLLLNFCDEVQEPYYLKSWGPNMSEQMSDGILSSDHEIVTVYKWLLEGSTKL